MALYEMDGAPELWILAYVDDACTELAWLPADYDGIVAPCPCRTGDPEGMGVDIMVPNFDENPRDHYAECCECGREYKVEWD